MRVLLVFLITAVNLFSQSKIVDISVLLGDDSFSADKLEVSNTGYYLLDSDERQMVFISNNSEVSVSGGYGISDDSFIDPIDILTSKLKVYIVDGTENNIIIYDHKLNYLSSMSFKEIYPTFCGIDNWENIYLFSEIENKIFKWSETTNEVPEFIDLSNYDFNEKSVNYISITENGDIAILTDEEITIFNRLGNIVSSIPVNQQINHVFKHTIHWYGIDVKNNIVNLNYDEQVQSLDSEKILDIDYFNDRLYILYKNQIRIVDVELE